MTRVRQRFDKEEIADLRVAVRAALSAPEIAGRIRVGQKVAVAVGSRGIHRLEEIVRTVVEFLKERDAQPFVIAAMGSHGGGTAEGQRGVLAGYGITEERIGAPVVVDMDTVSLGKTSGGVEVFTDRVALEAADMTVLINRIKPHTDFNGPVESGLCKMAVIGLGNHRGCVTMHRVAFEEFHALIPEAARIVFEKGTIGFGLAIVENAADRTAYVKAIPAARILAEEPEIFADAERRMARLFIPEIDVLILEEIGKNISGAGFDPNIIGRFGPKAEKPGIPKSALMVILDLTEETHGNALGVGFADITTKAVLEKMDFESTYANAIASGNLVCAALPPAMADEKEAIAAAVKFWGGDPASCRIVRIKNTLEVEEILVSENLLPFIRKNPERFTLL